MLVIGEKWGILLNYFGVIQSYEKRIYSTSFDEKIFGKHGKIMK